MGKGRPPPFQRFDAIANYMGDPEECGVLFDEYSVFVLQEEVVYAGFDNEDRPLASEIKQLSIVVIGKCENWVILASKLYYAPLVTKPYYAPMHS